MPTQQPHESLPLLGNAFSAMPSGAFTKALSAKLSGNQFDLSVAFSNGDGYIPENCAFFLSLTWLPESISYRKVSSFFAILMVNESDHCHSWFTATMFGVAFSLLVPTFRSVFRTCPAVKPFRLSLFHGTGRWVLSLSRDCLLDSYRGRRNAAVV